MEVIQKVIYERPKDGFRRLGEKNLRLTELGAQPFYEEATESDMLKPGVPRTDCFLTDS